MVSERISAPPAGPYVQAALFCEYVIREVDNTVSLVRVVDRITHTESGPNTPEDLPSFTYRLKAVLMIKGGGARGRSNLVVRMEQPSGLMTDLATATLQFTGAPSSGVTSVLDMTISFEQEGLHWFDVEVDGLLLSRMPLEIHYRRITTGPSQ